MDETKFLALLKKEFKKNIPSGNIIFEEAIRENLGKNINNSEWIKTHFSELVESIQVRAYQIYLRHEKESVSKSFRQAFGSILNEDSKKEDFLSILENSSWALDKFFLGLTQGRRPRAGKAFEHIIKQLFNILGYPYTPQPIINGQPDFLLPSVNHFNKNAMDCIIFTVKRTLRERWRQIVTEGTRGYLFFLATIDTKIATRDLEQIQNHRIYLVMPEKIRATKYPNQINVISFETFFEQHLDPAMKRWKKNKIIK
ncbi:MAG: type II restriction endonuclease [Phycisphaerales bacterium]